MGAQLRSHGDGRPTGWRLERRRFYDDMRRGHCGSSRVQLTDFIVTTGAQDVLAATTGLPQNGCISTNHFGQTKYRNQCSRKSMRGSRRAGGEVRVEYAHKKAVLDRIS
ncbi:hypothetical protein F442_03745 [Phytophthora nicotianae P10297]|uniref:Uncharacterized protein n=3 Tax=Phytophthora nicotianae TaxID=4792 RepID=V9FQB0_PHYNI|nr:hypothetical protein F443_03764 [Phytophthora nicotianae P1569]ETL99657.1 hypothetical protein L917_03522 [Phytophthora nicotianae]ETM52814.1 hypothetical protein L914_03624 [Phytophthora nicotianae]ETP51049.1 hypothetical protein F442_03745 [Phytophthora nicotianae P10297]